MMSPRGTVRWRAGAATGAATGAGAGGGGVTPALMMRVYSPPLAAAGAGVPTGDRRIGGALAPPNGEPPPNGGRLGSWGIAGSGIAGSAGGAGIDGMAGAAGKTGSAGADEKPGVDGREGSGGSDGAAGGDEKLLPNDDRLDRFERFDANIEAGESPAGGDSGDSAGSWSPRPRRSSVACDDEVGRSGGAALPAPKAASASGAPPSP